MPTHVMRVPGATRPTSERSMMSMALRGSSPGGTSSGVSCSLSDCWSTYLDLSATSRYGSSGHGSGPCCSTEAWHLRGLKTPPMPGLHEMVSGWPHWRHLSWMSVALDLGRDAAVTMPENMICLPMYEAVSSRSLRGRSSEPSSTCTFSTCTSVSASTPSSSSLVTRACSMAISSAAAASNSGRYSAGLCRSSVASSSSKRTRCSMRTFSTLCASSALRSVSQRSR
mmetsp:Transcript_13137/g.41025  ORF Transcript_13137/g.41025 Transcript_13137/m.41025 type:complete len:226 (-) Transcript_13137:294-971(-)